MHHAELDARSLQLHRLIADKIRQDPALLAHARTTLARWRETVCPASQPYLLEWERAFNAGMDTCLRLATEDSEHARALRQCSPFAGLLSNQERFAFLKKWRRQHETHRA